MLIVKEILSLHLVFLLTRLQEAAVTFTCESSIDHCECSTDRISVRENSASVYLFVLLGTFAKDKNMPDIGSVVIMSICLFFPHI